MMLMTMEFPLNREILTTIRLSVGGLCALTGFDLEAAEDCKVCVTEGLLLLMHGGSERARLSFARENGLRVCMEGTGKCAPGESAPEEEISIALLTALVEDLSWERGENGSRIEFLFKGL